MLVTLRSISPCLRPIYPLVLTVSNLLSLLYFLGLPTMLSLNRDKSDAILLGTNSPDRTLTSVRNVDVFGSSLTLSDSVKLLGVTCDSNLTFPQHINLVSQSCFYHIKPLCHIRHSLDTQTASLVAHALTTSRLDYANSVLFGSLITVLSVPQRVQNSLARFKFCFFHPFTTTIPLASN